MLAYGGHLIQSPALLGQFVWAIRQFALVKAHALRTVEIAALRLGGVVRSEDIEIIK
jgi:hypothetical protein